MPPIFSQVDKEAIRKNLISTGIDMIKNAGIQKINVEELTRQVGIAKGTFYHFFESKQMFIIEIICDYRERKLSEFEQLFLGKDEIPIDDVVSWYQNSYHTAENPLSYITPADAQWLRQNVPAECVYSEAGDIEIAKTLLHKVKDVRPDIDYAVVANIPKIIFLAMEHREELHQGVLSQNIEMMLRMLKNYVLKEERK